jgi:hypothetical protein
MKLYLEVLSCQREKCHNIIQIEHHRSLPFVEYDMLLIELADCEFSATLNRGTRLTFNRLRILKR